MGASEVAIRNAGDYVDSGTIAAVAIVKGSPLIVGVRLMPCGCDIGIEGTVPGKDLIYD